VNFVALKNLKKEVENTKYELHILVTLSPLPVYDVPSTLLHKKRPGMQTCRSWKPRYDIFNLWDTNLLNVFLSTLTPILMSGCSCTIIVTMQRSIILYYIILYYIILYYIFQCHVFAQSPPFWRPIDTYPVKFAPLPICAKMFHSQFYLVATAIPV
jgi:hypothetical protein